MAAPWWEAPPGVIVRQLSLWLAFVAFVIFALLFVESASAQMRLGERHAVSKTGPEGDERFQALFPKVAFNNLRGEYLAAWHSDAGADDDREIHVRRLAADGTPLGPQRRISDSGPAGDPAFAAVAPDVVFNPVTAEYLVAWSGRDDRPSMGPEEKEEIFVQRLDQNGFEVGVDDQRISTMGPDDHDETSAIGVDLAVDSGSGEYLAAWQGHDNGESLDEHEIFVQQLAPDGREVGSDDLQISRMGTDGDHRPSAYSPAVAHSSRSDEYLVAWGGSHDDYFFEQVYVQRLNASAEEVGVDDRQISSMADRESQGVWTPMVAYNDRRNEYLVGWMGWNPPEEEGESGEDVLDAEIRVQRLNASAEEVGPDDLQISSMGAGDPSRDALWPAMVYHSDLDEYLVVWAGDDETDGEVEVYGQRLDSQGLEVGVDDERYTSFGPDGDTGLVADFPALAAGAGAGYLLSWVGGTRNGSIYVLPGSDNPGTADDELEIYARALRGTRSAPEPEPDDPPPPTAPGPGDPSPPPEDATPEDAEVAGAWVTLRQGAIVRKGRVRLRAAFGCRETCAARIRGKLVQGRKRFPLKAKRRTDEPGSRTALGLRLRGGKKRQVRRTRRVLRAQRRGRRLQTRLVVKFEDRAGNESKLRVRKPLRLRRARGRN